MVFERAAGKIGISLFDVAANSWEVSTGRHKVTGFTLSKVFFENRPPITSERPVGAGGAAARYSS